MSFPQECRIQVPLRGPCQSTLYTWNGKGAPWPRWWGPCLSLGVPSALAMWVPACPGWWRVWGGLNVPTRVSPHPPSAWRVPSSPQLLPGLSTIQVREGQMGPSAVRRRRPQLSFWIPFWEGRHKALEGEGMGVPGP